ncbi:LPS-assembly protein LptD [Acidocella sp.]|uniref:LPS-assembly protein LptD n=1 Tax=Acidocella sp. TaxID=50710 RepID=UPI0017D72C19|nr:LPS assembly protein LptD [Acidocella sp.]NNM56711.1 LPS-assembly protein LptD [Acidocella sp.]
MKRSGLLLTLIASTCLAGQARAQQVAPPSAPVSFTADSISYDKTGNIVTASGHVRAVQNGQTLRADKVVLDRNTDVVTASGHVSLTQPSGDTVFARRAVLSKGMKDAVMRGVAARLADNGRMIANGARRYGGKVDEMVKVVYSACDLCKTDPSAPPIWQIRAKSATRDLQHKMIEYRGAEMEFYGVPVLYVPYFTQPDPSVKRQSGFLMPGFGVTSKLGFFFTTPYYYVIDKESDLTLTPIFAVKEGPALKAGYRRDFNDGELNVNVSGGQVSGKLGDAVFANGTFDLNQDWRAGFNYNRASNPAYLNDFNVLPNASFLSSNVFLEGFSPGAYARLDMQSFQGLVASVNQSELPIVSPYGQYDFISGQDALGGQFSLHADMFNVLRKLGTNSQRVAAVPGYSVPFMLPYGVLGTARVELVAASYMATRLYEQPNYSPLSTASTARAQPYGAVYLHWPLIRQAGALGSQIIEPEVQLVASPNIGISQNIRIPNEDSLDLEYSDANLFSLNRYPGIDRLEGGSRVDYALHAAWYLPGGAMLDGLIGQSYRVHKDNNYLPGSGLTGNVSDIVGHVIIAPVPHFNVTYRTRLSHRDLGARMIDTTANYTSHVFTASAGYLYTNTDPYVLYDSASIVSPTLAPPAAYFTPRHEVTANFTANIGPWSLGAGSERNLQTGKFDAANFSAGWQNDCFGVNLVYYQRFTSFNLDKGNTTVLLQFTFKTLGNVGFSAL